MKAAVVHELGKAPVYSDFEEPVPASDEVRVHVTASALTNFTKLRALGKHYSFSSRPPFVVGIDGIGTLDDGRRVYFLFPRAPFGGMAERTVVSASRCLDVPDGVDDVRLAALADPGMSAWVALEARAKMIPGETVLINGATGSAGGIAVQIAKHLGAHKVIVTGRNREALDRLVSIGADQIVVLDSEGNAPEGVLRRHFSGSMSCSTISGEPARFKSSLRPEPARRRRPSASSNSGWRAAPPSRFRAVCSGRRRSRSWEAGSEASLRKRYSASSGN